MDCPGFERMIDYFDGRLAASEASMIEQHLAGCASCGSVVVWYRRVKAIAARDESVEPPGWVLKRALKAFMAYRDRYGAEVPVSMAAILVFDSLNRPEIGGVRSTDAADRQLLYRAGGYSVDLQMAWAGVAAVNVMG